MDDWSACPSSHGSGTSGKYRTLESRFLKNTYSDHFRQNRVLLCNDSQ